MKDILTIPKANNQCPCCNGKGRLPNNVGFELKVGDIVEDHCGVRVRVDSVYHLDKTLGWGTTLNAPSWRLNHSNHRIDTNNDFYAESLWVKITDARLVEEQSKSNL